MSLDNSGNKPTLIGIGQKYKNICLIKLLWPFVAMGLYNRNIVYKVINHSHAFSTQETDI